MSEKASLTHDVLSSVDGGRWSTNADPTYLAPTAAHTARYVKHGPQSHSRSNSPPKSKDYDLMTVHLKDLRHVGHIHHRNCCLPNDDNPNAVLSFVSEDKPKRSEWNPSTYVKKEKGPSILAHPKAVHLRERVLDASDKNRGSLFGTHPDNVPTLWNNSFHIGDGANLVNTARHPSTRLYFGDPDRDILNPSAGTIVNNHKVTVLPPQPLCSKVQHSRTRRRQGAAREALLGLGADYSYSRTVNMLGEQCAEVSLTTAKTVGMETSPEKSPEGTLSGEGEFISGMTVLNAMYGPNLRQRHTQRAKGGTEGDASPRPSTGTGTGTGTGAGVVEEQAQALLSEHTQALEHHRRARARANGALGDATDAFLTTSPPSLTHDTQDTQRSLVTRAEGVEVDTSHFLGLAYLSPSERGHTVQALTFSQTRGGSQAVPTTAAGMSVRGGVCVLAEEERIPDAAQLRPHVHAEDARIAALTRMAAPVENQGKRPWDARVFRPLGASEDESTSLGWCTTMGVSETESGALKPTETFRSLGDVVSAWPMVPGVVHGTVSSAEAGMVRRAHEAQGGYVDVMLRDTAESALATLVRRGVVREGTQTGKRGKHGGMAGIAPGDRGSRGGKGGYAGMVRGNGGKGTVNVDDENYTELAQKLHTLALRERGWDTTLVQDVTPPPFVLKRHVLATRHGEVAPDIHSSFGGNVTSLGGYARPANHRAEIGAVAPDAIDYLSLPPLPQLHQQMQTQTPAQQGQGGDGDGDEEDHDGDKGPEKAKTRRGKKHIPKVIVQLLDLNNARYNVLSALSIHKHPYPFAHLRRDARAWLREALKDHKTQVRQARASAHQRDGRGGLDVQSNQGPFSSSSTSTLSSTSASADLSRTSAALRRAVVAAKHEEEMEAADMYRQRAGIHDFDTLEDRTAGVRQEPAPVSKYKPQWQSVAGREDLARNSTNTTAKTRAKVTMLKKLTPGQKRLRAAATAVLRRLQGMGPSSMLNSARTGTRNGTRTRTGTRQSSSRGVRPHTINWTPIGTLPDASILEHELVRDATAALDATRPITVALPAPVPVSVDRSVALAHLRHPPRAPHAHPPPHPHTPIATSGGTRLPHDTTSVPPNTNNATYARDGAPAPSPRANTYSGMQRGGWRSTDLVKPRLRRGGTSGGASARSNTRRAPVPAHAHTSQVDRLRLRAGWQGIGSGKGVKPGEGTGIYRDATSIHTQYSNMMMDEPVLDLASLRAPNGDFAIQKRIRESGRVILHQQATATQAEVHRLEQLLAELRSRTSRASSAASKAKDVEREQELVRARAEALERLVMLRDAHGILGHEPRNGMNVTSHDTIVEHLLPEAATTEKNGMHTGMGAGSGPHGSTLLRALGERKLTDLDTINTVYSVDPHADAATKPRATIAIAAARKQEKQARLAALRAENLQTDASRTTNPTTSSTSMSSTALAMGMFAADAYSYEDDGVDMPIQPRYILPQELDTQRASTTPLHMHANGPRTPVIQLFPSLGDSDADVYAQQLHAAIHEQESHPYYRQQHTKTHQLPRPQPKEMNTPSVGSADPGPVPGAADGDALSVGTGTGTGTGTDAGAGSADATVSGGDAGLSATPSASATVDSSPPHPPSTPATVPSITSSSTVASVTATSPAPPAAASNADAIAVASTAVAASASVETKSRPMSSSSTADTTATPTPLPSSATTDAAPTHTPPSVATGAVPTHTIPYAATDPTLPPQQPPGFTVMLAEPPSVPIGVDMGVRVYVSLPPRPPPTRTRSRTPVRAHVPPSAFSEDVSETTVGSPRPLTQEERQRVAVEGPFVPQVTRTTSTDDDPVRARANITSPPPGFFSFSSSSPPAAAGAYGAHEGGVYTRGMGVHPPHHTRISPRGREYTPEATVAISPRSRSRGQSPIIGMGARAMPLSAGGDRRAHARSRSGQPVTHTPERVSRRGTPNTTTTNTPTPTIATTPAPTTIPPSYTYPFADVEAQADETDRLTPLPQFARHSSRKSSKHKRPTRSASRGHHSSEKPSRHPRGTGTGVGVGVRGGSRGTSTASSHMDGIRGSLTKPLARNAAITTIPTLPIITSTSQYDSSSGRPVKSRPTTLMSTSVSSSSSSSAPTSASASHNLPDLRVYYHEQYEAPVKHAQPSTAMFTLAKREGEMQDAWSAYDGAIAKALER